MTLTPGETAMIAGDLAMKAADVHIGFSTGLAARW